MCGIIEDNEHLWVCPAHAEVRREAMATYIHTIQDIGTPNELVTLIQLGLSNLLNIPSPPIHELQVDNGNTLMAMMIQAGQDQTSLGWDNYLRGRHSKLFAQSYDAYLATKPIHKTKYTKGITWAARLVRESLLLLGKIWMIRNKEIHNPTRDDQGHTTKLSDQRIKQRVEEVYDDMSNYHQLIQANLFNIPREERTKQSTFHLVKWLETVDRAQNAWKRGPDNIHQYFHPTRPPAVPNGQS